MVTLKCLGGQEQLPTSGLRKGLVSSAPGPAGAEGSSLAGCPLPAGPVAAAGARQGLTEAQRLGEMEGQGLNVWRCSLGGEAQRALLLPEDLGSGG